MKKIIHNKDKGILFFIFGLSGSGKTTIAKKIKKRISHFYGPTIEISGNDMRKTFMLNKFSQKGRKTNLPIYNRFKKLITDKKINLIFNVTGHLKKDWQWNRKNIDNYVEIYIKADIHKIIKLRKKKIYLKNKKNVVGLDIKAEFPSNPQIVIHNNFDRTTTNLANECMSKIKKIMKT